jgi:hypothetical protein
MKVKALKTKYIVLFIIILIPVSFIFYVVYYSYTIEHNQELSVKYINQLVEYPEGDYNTNNTKEIIKGLSYVNPKIFKKMVKKNIKIKFINSNLTENKEIMTLLGGMTASKGITMENTEGFYVNFNEFLPGTPPLVVMRIDVMVNATDGTEIHEIAHAADDIMGNVSQKEKFIEIYKEEMNNIFSNKGYEEWLDSQEYFAEVFTYYYAGEMTRKMLKTRVPKTYEFIKEFIHDFN